MKRRGNIWAFAGSNDKKEIERPYALRRNQWGFKTYAHSGADIAHAFLEKRI